eukprot:COSAG02_NODE_39740_length_413_cov_1.057325_1_plen_20_part_10
MVASDGTKSAGVRKNTAEDT